MIRGKLACCHQSGLGIARSWLAAVTLFFLCGGVARAGAADADAPVRVAVYDLAPYGSVDAGGLFSGVSVDLWRRVAEDLHLTYRLAAVAQMEDILTGLETGQFDVAIGAITITPERLARVDFSYPAHRSGVAVALPGRGGPISAVVSYGNAVRQHTPLIGVTVVLLLLTATLMWSFERRRQAAAQSAELSVTTLFDGVYWAVVTMTTVGYGDKTPKTRAGRFIAVLWMLTSLGLISLVSTSMVSSMTAARLELGPLEHDTDLAGKRLAAVAYSSGAEYLDSRHLRYTKYNNLQEALTALAGGEADAVVNSVGALQYMVSTRFYGVIAVPSGLLAPAYMAFALPLNSPMKKPLDRAMVRVTASPAWQTVEANYFDR